MYELNVETKRKEEIVDITDDVSRVVADAGVDYGACVVFVPHTTAGVTVNENADPDVKSDMLLGLGDIVKNDARFRHAEGNSVAHIKSTLVGCSVTVPVKDGKIALGRWQGIYFCEFDGGRKRKVRVLVK
ncbi:MAG: YjbQ family protein [Candidatus Nanohalarchaeota archaeon]|nr:MAG: YjbQ family protein [Candidatus Nanohaloarchaeota archaeon]